MMSPQTICYEATGIYVPTWYWHSCALIINESRREIDKRGNQK